MKVKNLAASITKLSWYINVNSILYFKLSRPSSQSLSFPLAFFIILFLSMQSVALLGAPKKKITFPSLDGLQISADLYYSKSSSKGFILLFHQAASSRGEYAEIAPILQKNAYNSMAIDQRSGQAIAGVTNETAARAFHKKKETRLS